MSAVFVLNYTVERFLAGVSCLCTTSPDVVMKVTINGPVSSALCGC